MVVLLGIHAGIRCLRGDAKANCHAMQDGGVDVGGRNPGSNEALLNKDGQRREVHLGR